jgi:hypothetical protein
MTSAISVSMVTAALLIVCAASIAQSVQDPSVQCVLDLASKPEFSHISDKLPVGDIRKITFAMLANDAVPTVAERNEIAAWFAAKEECGKLGESFRQTHYPPEVISQVETSITTLNLIGVDLYKGKITYGEANKRLAAARDDLMSKLTTIVQAYKKEIEVARAEATQAQAQAEDRRLQAANQASQAAAQAEEQRRQRLQMMFNYLQANRIQIAPPPQLQIRPGVTTNCTTVGGQTNCYTH